LSQQIQDATCIACTKTARERADFSTLCSLSCSFLFVSLITSQAIAADFSGRVVGIIDGDTLEVLHLQRAERIRLNGIDCPEKAQAYGTRAEFAVADLAFGKEVTVKTHGLDKYTRTLADWFLPDGTNVNYTLVTEGGCWWYRKYAPGETVFERLEKNARAARTGLWADPQPVPPWKWRKQRK
jgi:micrococcal nuclease